MIMKCNIGMCLWIGILMTVLPAQEGKINVALVDLKGEGIEGSTANLITDRIRSEMIKNLMFVVLERSEMDKVLKEQGFQSTGACSEQSCAVEMGQLLGVRKMITGTVGKVGTMYTISLRVIDVESGQIVFTVYEDCRCMIEDVFSTVTKRIVDKLTKGMMVTPESIAGKMGILQIETDPAGARIVIDGKEIEAPTPVTLQNFPAGAHRVEASQGELWGAQEVFLVPNDLLKVKVEMEKARASIVITSQPSPARVFIDNKETGNTPLKLESIPAGRHLVRVELDGFAPSRLEVVLEKDETRNVDAKLEKAAFLSVRVAPASASVSVNGILAGRGPIQRYSTPEGTTVVRVFAPGHEPAEEKISLTAGETKSLSYSLKIRKSYADSVSAARKAKHRKQRNVRRVVFGISGIGFGVAGFLTNMQVDEQVKEQKKIADAYHGATGANLLTPADLSDTRAKTTFNSYRQDYNNARNKAEKAISMRNLLYGLAGVCGVGFTISIGF